MSQILHTNNLSQLLSEKEIKMFSKLQSILKRLNKSTNLTRLIDADDYWISQVYDSIWPFIENKERPHDNKKFIDIGSGCGFPGLAYAITHPNSEIYLIDSSIKKTKALNTITQEMNLTNDLFIIRDRVETFAHVTKFRNYFDIGATRAVSEPATVAEYLLPMLNKKGFGILYCGKWEKRSQQKLEKSLSILKGRICTLKRKNLPLNRGERNAIFIKPEEICPTKFPREIGKPKKFPLGN
tara:strand:- start:3962 stop:4681 length:720 start_codon:yes stop_codon:yes gene_type:complete